MSNRFLRTLSHRQNSRLFQNVSVKILFTLSYSHSHVRFTNTYSHIREHTRAHILTLSHSFNILDHIYIVEYTNTNIHTLRCICRRWAKCLFSKRIVQGCICERCICMWEPIAYDSKSNSPISTATAPIRLSILYASYSTATSIFYQLQQNHIKYSFWPVTSVYYTASCTYTHLTNVQWNKTITHSSNSDEKSQSNDITAILNSSIFHRYFRVSFI